MFLERKRIPAKPFIVRLQAHEAITQHIKLFKSFLNVDDFDVAVHFRGLDDRAGEVLTRAKVTKFEALALRTFGKSLSQEMLKTAMSELVETLKPIDGSKYVQPTLWKRVCSAVAAG